ncbi:MAG: class I SAM-dependent methyltransferase [Anaerolineae bacterium]|nr:class I SAM-dependent methyltransferase [Anaerolineae bacterium]
MNEQELNQYYTALAANFNAAAQHYDLQSGPPSGSHPGHTLLTWLREEHIALLRDLLPDEGAVIDLGCGTGIETLTLAQAGYQVLGVDVSSGMVRQAQTKVAAFGVKDRVTFKTLPAAHLGTISDRGPYDGAFASLGALNTEPQLDKLAEALHDLLVPGAPFVATVMSRHCWFEIRHNLRRFKPGKTMKRGGTWREGRAGTGGVQAPVTFYQPDAFAQHFAPHFTVESVIAFPLLLPPVHMVDLYRERAEEFAARLDQEREMRGRQGWRAWGDHFLMVLRHDGAAGAD